MEQKPVTESLDLTGRVAIVTGGSRGIGRSIALGFAQHGASVVITSRDQSNCEETVSEITKIGGTAVPIAAHMGKLSQVENLVLQTVEAYGAIDIIVNNAANPLMLGVGDITPEAWETVSYTHLTLPTIYSV